MDKDQKQARQMIRELFANMPVHPKSVKYAFGLLMNSPTKTIHAQTTLTYGEKEYEWYLTLWMVAPDDFLLQFTMYYVDDPFWVRGTMEYINTWLEKLQAPANDKMLWYWSLHVTSVRKNDE